MKVRTNIHPSSAPTPTGEQQTADRSLPPLPPRLCQCSGVCSAPPVHLHRSLAGFREAWPRGFGVPATAILSSYLEVCKTHGHVIRCTVENWLGSQLTEVSAHLSLCLAGTVPQNFLLCPHVDALRHLPGARDGYLVRHRCHRSTES